MLTGLFPEWTWIVGLFIGAAIGSFLNMLIYRLPRIKPKPDPSKAPPEGDTEPELTLLSPSHSICPTCKHRLGVLDLFPLLSWLFLGGKCRHCRAPIGARYFIVELVTGGLWAAVWYQCLIQTDQPVKAVFYMLAMAALVCLSWIDMESYTIPDVLNVVILLLGVGYQLYQRTPMVAVYGALAGWGILWGIGLLGRLLFGKDAMGEGDVMLMRGAGALIGPIPVIAAIMIAVCFGAIFGIGGIILDKMSPLTQGPANAAEEVLPPAQPIWQVFVIGGLLLFCVDVIAFFIPPVGKLIEKVLPDAAGLDDDAWEPPSKHYLPFGPSLALGTATMMLFQPQVMGLVDAYLKQFRGS